MMLYCIYCHRDTLVIFSPKDQNHSNWAIRKTPGIRNKTEVILKLWHNVTYMWNTHEHTGMSHSFLLFGHVTLSKSMRHRVVFCRFKVSPMEASPGTIPNPSIKARKVPGLGWNLEKGESTALLRVVWLGIRSPLSLDSCLVKCFLVFSSLRYLCVCIAGGYAISVVHPRILSILQHRIIGCL